MAFLDRFRPSKDSIPWPAIAAGSGLFVAGLLVRGFLSGKKQGTVNPSPLTTVLPKLSKEEIAKLPYPPDALPGARDVATPYGSIRVSIGEICLPTKRGRISDKSSRSTNGVLRTVERFSCSMESAHRVYRLGLSLMA